MAETTACKQKNLTNIQERIWQSSLPVFIYLSSTECRNTQELTPYFAQLPRLSFLTFIVPRLHSFYRSQFIYPVVDKTSVWFSWNRVPLPQHFPIGLLYDIFGLAGVDAVEHEDKQIKHEDSTRLQPRVINVGQDGRAAGEDKCTQQQQQQITKRANSPWSITVHWQDFPGDSLLRINGEAILRDLFNSSVKEASFLRHSSAKVIMSLGVDSSLKLWESVVQRNLSLYTSVYTKLISSPGITLKHVPLRIYVPRYLTTTSSMPVSLARSTSSQIDTVEPTSTCTANVDVNTFPGLFRVIQMPVTPLDSSGQINTMGRVLNTLLPSLFPQIHTWTSALPILHGAVVPCSAELIDLMTFAAYPDSWINVCILTQHTSN